MRGIGTLVLMAMLVATARADGPGLDPAAVERGRVALTEHGYLRPNWKPETYAKVGEVWGTPHPDPKSDPEGYAAAFNRRYGFQPAPFPNDGLPLGLRRGEVGGKRTAGFNVDCMICHGGSIGGTSYVGLGNASLDISLLFQEFSRAEGNPWRPAPFVANTARGTVNAGQMAAFLLSLKNTDFSRRSFPLPLGVNLPELDVPAWWILGKKQTMYYDGGTSADSVRANMQFVMAEKTLDEMKALEPTFADIQAYLKSIKPPKYPFEVDPARAAQGKAVFEKACTKCHGTYGPGGAYPNVVVDIKTIGTDPARVTGMTRRAVEHYNATWLGQDHPATPDLDGYQAPPLDGIWATAPYLHNGSVPTLHALLHSPERPKVFRRPASTEFKDYDKANVGWRVEPLTSAPVPPRPPTPESRAVYDTGRYGLGNGGHTFGDRLSEVDRMAVIEYLKML